jgi:hypothetical protein
MAEGGVGVVGRLGVILGSGPAPGLVIGPVDRQRGRGALIGRGHAGLDESVGRAIEQRRFDFGVDTGAGRGQMQDAFFVGHAAK